MSFEYPYTCDKIDKEIDNAKEIIQIHLDKILCDACPLLLKEQHDNLIKEWTEELYDELEDCFETVRKSNGDMRDEAEKQLTTLETEIVDLKQELEDAKSD